MPEIRVTPVKLKTAKSRIMPDKKEQLKLKLKVAQLFYSFE
jgi:hypothetical protein